MSGPNSSHLAMELQSLTQIQSINNMGISYSTNGSHSNLGKLNIRIMPHSTTLKILLLLFSPANKSSKV
ncbi:hypothetical protein KCU81_g3622, partial [Aureobasidium melanogenum]